MDDGQVTLSSDSPQLYERGRLVAHSSDESGIADVGLSIGLGNGWMLFLGDCFPGSIDSGWGLKLYGQTESHLIAEGIEGEKAEAARDMIERIAGAICSATAPASENTDLGSK